MSFLRGAVGNLISDHEVFHRLLLREPAVPQSGAVRSNNASMDKNDTMDLSAGTCILKRREKRGVGDDAMAKAKSAPSCGCPVAAFQKMISGKYKLRIVWDLKDGPRRYGEIRTRLLRGSSGSAEIAPRVLSRELKALTETGLIDRKDFGVVPPKVEYRLTRKGRSFVPVIAAIRNWGARHLAQAGEKVDAVAAAGSGMANQSRHKRA